MSVFSESIESLAQRNGLPREECVDMLRKMYDGYHFHPRAAGMYNPFSVLNTLSRGEFGSYWFETGNPLILFSCFAATTTTWRRWRRPA